MKVHELLLEVKGIGISTSDTGPVFSRYRVNTNFLQYQSHSAALKQTMSKSKGKQNGLLHQYSSPKTKEKEVSGNFVISASHPDFSQLEFFKAV